MTSFYEIAPFYDELMSSVPYASWADYLELLLVHQDIQTKELLEACCGTGTVAELMSERGYNITGFDLSAPMIDVARRKARQNESLNHYFVSDATQLSLPKKFGAAYCFFDSLNYITSVDGLHAALKKIALHLSQDGLFIFDLNTEYAFEEQLFTQSDLRKKARVRYDWKGEYDKSTRIIEVKMKFWFQGREFYETHIQRAHSTEEVSAGLRAAGFELFHVFDSYTLDPPNNTSDRLHYVARMPR